MLQNDLLQDSISKFLRFGAPNVQSDENLEKYEGLIRDLFSKLNPYFVSGDSASLIGQIIHQNSSLISQILESLFLFSQSRQIFVDWKVSNLIFKHL